MTRRTNPADPTSERTADQSTQTASGLTGGRPVGDGRERARMQEQDDRDDEEIIPRTREERGTTPRKYEHADDKALPSDVRRDRSASR